MPEMFLIMGVVFVLAPIARAIARSIERGGLPRGPDSAQQDELRRALQLAEQRLSETESRLATLEDRVDFYEKLLSNPTSSSGRAPPSLPS